MRITIEQSEIEEAIERYVLNQMTIAENMEMKIDLRATRGDAGYTADIVISERPPLDIKGKVVTARKTAAAKTETETKSESESKPETKAETKSDPKPESKKATEAGSASESKPDTSAKADAPTEEPAKEETTADKPTGSIFGGLKKPVNESAS